MKKFLKIIMLAVLAIACFGTAIACTQDNNGEKEKGVLCKTINGVYTIYKYVDDGRTETTLDLGVELGEGIDNVKIKKNAFSGNNTITEIIVPSKVTVIEEGAFAGMKALEKLTLPYVGSSNNADPSYGETGRDDDKTINKERTFGYLFGTSEYDGGSKVEIRYNSSTDGTEIRYMPTTLIKVEVKAEAGYNIPMHAFDGCVNLTEIKLSDGIEKIGENAFNGCKNLVNISIPQTVTKILKNAFNGCTSLSANVLSQATALTEIGESAFENAKLENINLPQDIKIGTKAFFNSTVKTVLLKGQIEIGSSAFSGCTLLTAVSLEDVTNGVIRQFAFKGAERLNQFGETLNTINLTNFITVENLAFADIFEDDSKITVLSNGLNHNAIFGW